MGMYMTHSSHILHLCESHLSRASKVAFHAQPVSIETGVKEAKHGWEAYGCSSLQSSRS